MTRKAETLKQQRKYINLQQKADKAGVKQGIIKQNSNILYAFTDFLINSMGVFETPITV